jgi:hypothetical protein
MSAIYGPNSVNLPHVNVFRWAQKNNIFLPVDLRKTKEEEIIFLKYLANHCNFVKLSANLEKSRFSAALKEAIRYLPSNGYSDKMVMIFQIAGTIFFVICAINGKSKL